jgi:hypothetical protein
LRCAIGAPFDADASWHCTTREFRGRHLFLIAFGVWLLGFTSVLLLDTSVQQRAVRGSRASSLPVRRGIAAALFKARAQVIASLIC